jgi:MFS family permease
VGSVTARETDPAELTLPTPRSYLVWAVGILGYALLVMQRTTFGFSGLDAAARFGISPSALSGFVFVQLTVYLAMQIPAGVLVDRWGARAVVVLSGGLASAGQALLAVTTELAPAMLARVLVGGGDALMFVAVLALLPRWFPARRVPVVTQLTTILGQTGQLLSAVPFLAVLHRSGWTAAYSSAAALCLVGTALALALLRNGPVSGHPPAPSASPGEILRQLRRVWRRPGTRLGFFGHMATQFPMMVFSLLWGVPYLVTAQRLSPEGASGLLSLFVLCTIAVGPVMGVLTMRHPLRRSWLLLGVCAGTAAVWTVVLTLPGPAPRWLLVVLVVVLACGGPGSVVGFDIARTFNPRASLGVAQSMVNMGGFAATLCLLVLMGVVLDALGGFSFAAFRVAWLLQYPFWAIALVGVLVSRRQTRRVLAERGIVPRPLREVLKLRGPHR